MIIELKSIDIWETNLSLIIKHNDNHLIQINGNDVDTVNKIIKHLFHHGPSQKDATYEALFSNLQIEEEYFNQIIEWLLSNKILDEFEGSKAELDSHSIAFFGEIEQLTELEKIITTIFSDVHYNINFIHNVEEIKLLKPQLIISIMPIFMEKETIENISNQINALSIPLINFEVTPTTVTIGPLVIPARQTPTLLCYMKRRIANTVNAKKIITFIDKTDKKRVSWASKGNYRYLRISLEYLVCEVDKFFQFKGQLSESIIGKTISIDFTSHEIEKSIILKDPYSKVYNYQNYIPFNA